jgi:NO-binding membrane sensor protein with MHYT domain
VVIAIGAATAALWLAFRNTNPAQNALHRDAGSHLPRP